MKSKRDFLFQFVLALVPSSVCAFFPHSPATSSSSSGSTFISTRASRSRINTALDATRFCKAQSLVQSLVTDANCYSTEEGAREFAFACAINVVYEDRFEPQPIVGRQAVEQHMLEKVNQRRGKGEVRVDKVSDGNEACGFAWTWICGEEEGLRGTTFVQLNDQGQIQYVQEIPEPIFKPGDLTKELLKQLSSDLKLPPVQQYIQQTPTIANEVAKYLFIDLQAARDMDEMMRFFDDRVVYRDFNFEEPLSGPQQVRQFVEDFQFPGITFRPLRFDDGKDATCFTWELVLDGVEDTIKGISFYELDKTSRKVVYVRDVPESAIKPPILGKLARQLRPGLGVFQGFPIGSRPEGM